MGEFSLKKHYSLSPSFESLSKRGEGIISKEGLAYIFSFKRKAVPGSKSPVVARVEIVENGPEGVSKLRLLESARLKS